jgi:hypothetical protein
MLVIWLGLLRTHRDVAIEDMAGKVLLEISLGIQFEKQTHVRQWHTRDLGMTDMDIVNPRGERNIPRRRLKSLMDGLEVFRE